MSLRLRPLSLTDGPQVLAWRNSREVAAFMYTDHPIRQAEHQAWLAGAVGAPDRPYWIIELDDAPVGLANLAKIDTLARRCDWAYYLADPSVRGRGVGACVEALVLEHVFGPLGLNKLWCEVLLSNEPVWKLHESFGFQREALFRQHAFKNGAFEDVVGLGLLADEWRERRAAALARLLDKGWRLEPLSAVAA